MKTIPKASPARPNIHTFAPVVISRCVATGVDSYRVETGKPMFWLSAKEFADQFSVTRDAVYLWIASGIIPENLRERAGKIKWRISSGAVALLKEKFKSPGDGGAAQGLDGKSVPATCKTTEFKAGLKGR